MPFIDTNAIEGTEKRPGWTGRIFSSPSMTFAYWVFKEGADIHAHSHEQEEVWHVLEGQLKVTVDGETEVAGPGMVAIVPAQGKHKVVALTDGRAIVVDYPVRPDF
jgi:quercetin dioxygenase-like cupin family protein